MNNKEFSNEFWRGIALKDYYIDNLINHQAFQFSPNTERTDDYEELSINWNDSHLALELLLSQKKDNGKKQFSVGVAKVSLLDLKRFLGPYIKNGTLSYERKTLPENNYHGNLLLNKMCNKQNRALITNGLATLANNNDIVFQKEYNNK